LRGDTDTMCAELVERAGVLLLPSSVFDAGNERVRIGYGRKNLPDALAALESFL
jgi:aspartate/methionine/tyrosine aminotransferase